MSSRRNIGIIPSGAALNLPGKQQGSTGGILPNLGPVLSNPDHPPSHPTPGARPVTRIKAVEPAQAECGHGDEAAGQGEGGRDAVRADEAMSSLHDLADAWPHCAHSVATLSLRVCDGKAKFIHVVYRCPHRVRGQCKSVRKSFRGRPWTTSNDCLPTLPPV